VPWCQVVDSLTGKASEKTLKNINERGYASQHFAIEAGSLADYMRAHPQRLLGWPFTFVGVNHLKIQKDAQTGQIEKNMPGGWALKFQCAAIIEMNRLGKIQEFATYKAANLSMSTYKNSYGPDGMRIRVRFKTWQQNDAPAGAERVMRLHSRFEWWESSIELITKGEGMATASKDRMIARMREVCDIKTLSGKKYHCDRLGVSKSDAMTAHDLGLRLEEFPDVLGDLYEVTGVQRRPLFKPGVDYMKQLDDYAYIAAQADAADDAIRRQKLIQSGLSIEPSVAASPPDDVAEGDEPQPFGRSEEE
jgi:hypothetical protein